MRRAVSRRAEVENRLPISIVGHSVGGALAHLAALDLATRGFDVAEVWQHHERRRRAPGRGPPVRRRVNCQDGAWRGESSAEATSSPTSRGFPSTTTWAPRSRAEEEDGGPGGRRVADDSSPAGAGRGRARGTGRARGEGTAVRRGAAVAAGAGGDAGARGGTRTASRRGVAFPWEGSGGGSLAAVSEFEERDGFFLKYSRAT